jgi:hypothetical protein
VDRSRLLGIARAERHGPRDAADDFYCLRYRVWYPSLDCAYRTRFRTSPGCLECDQGRFNLRRHRAALRGVRLVPHVVD